MNHREKPAIAIVGGGITGLSAAWEIRQRAPEIDLILLEAGNRWGGKVLTQTMPGPDGGQFIIDAGPESFVTRKREIWDLVRELGLEDRVIDPGAEASGTYVLTEGRALRLPLDPISFISSPLLSARGKLRLLREPFIPAKRDDGDESLADFVTRRLGAEALEKFIGPVLGGIYNTNPETQSILVTSPIMRQMEAAHGSLVAATLARLRAGKQATADPNPPPSRFIGFRNGAEELINALVDQLDADMRLNTSVTAIEPNADGWAIITATERWTAGAVIMATPANVTARMLAGSAPEAAARLAEIRHNSIGTISLAYRTDDLSLTVPIRGLMIPRREGRRIDAVVYTSAKIPTRAPAGTGLLRVFFGGGDSTTATMPEAELVRVVRTELAELLGITAEPLDYRLARWPDSYAQADVGHLERVAAIEYSLPSGIYVAGGSYRGLAVPDCVKQGRLAGAQAVALSARSSEITSLSR
jgi:oxygen-dependent protoporphyrinogen oxidase